MSRQYHIVLREGQLNAVIGELGIGYHYATDELLGAYNILKQAKTRPYTNFDKIKDEMTVFQIYSLFGINNKKWCDKKCKYGQGECEVCVKNWLESEVEKQ